MTKLNEKEVLARSRASCLVNVRKLICWGSNLTDISIVDQMVNLEVLNISVNNITSLKHLSHCPRLKEVYMRKNQIQSIDQIAFLKNLPKLSVLWLEDNPIAKVPNYREIVLRNIPGLLKLDSVDVTEEERKVADTHGHVIESEELLPDYKGLDLNHTLSIDAVRLHIKGNRDNLCKSDERSPSRVVAYTIDPTLLESGEKPQSSNNSSLHESVKFECNGHSPPVSRSNDAMEYTGGHNGTKSRSSNTLQAVMLLLRELDSSELQHVQSCTLSLLREQNESRGIHRGSVNLLED